LGYTAKEVSFVAKDGYTLHGAIFSKIEDVRDTSRVLIIGSAFGVPYQYYKHIAGFFAENGILVLVYDYRGISHSQDGNMPTKKILMQHWGQLDLEAAIKFVKTRYNPKTLSYLGHSAGGQILGLAPSSNAFDNVILAASGVGSWHLWPGHKKYMLATVWYLIFPIVIACQFGDYFKSKLLGPIAVPKNAVKQWLKWARSSDYLFTKKHALDISGYEKINAEILGITITDDWYAPKEARDGLLKHYRSAKKKNIDISPQSIGLKSIGHFGLFKKKKEIREGIWQPMINFLND